MVQSRTGIIVPELADRGRSLAEQGNLGTFVLGRHGGITSGQLVWRVLSLGPLMMLVLFVAVVLAAVVIAGSLPLGAKAVLGLLMVGLLWLVWLGVWVLTAPRRWWVGLYENGFVLTFSRRRWDRVLMWTDVTGVSYTGTGGSDSLGTPALGSTRLVIRTRRPRRRGVAFGDLTNDLPALGTTAVRLHQKAVTGA